MNAFVCHKPERQNQSSYHLQTSIFELIQLSNQIEKQWPLDAALLHNIQKKIIIFASNSTMASWMI